MRDRQGDGFRYPFRREGGRSKGRKCPPVMPNDTRLIGPQGRNQSDGILGEQDRLIASVHWGGRWGIAAHEGRDRMKTRLGKGRQEGAVGIRIIRKAVQTQDERSVAGFEAMKVMPFAVTVRVRNSMLFSPFYESVCPLRERRRTVTCPRQRAVAVSVRSFSSALEQS